MVNLYINHLFWKAIGIRDPRDSRFCLARHHFARCELVRIDLKGDESRNPIGFNAKPRETVVSPVTIPGSKCKHRKIKKPVAFQLGVSWISGPPSSEIPPASRVSPTEQVVCSHFTVVWFFRLPVAWVAASEKTLPVSPIDEWTFSTRKMWFRNIHRLS